MPTVVPKLIPWRSTATSLLKMKSELASTQKQHLLNLETTVTSLLHTTTTPISDSCKFGTNMPNKLSSSTAVMPTKSSSSETTRMSNLTWSTTTSTLLLTPVPKEEKLPWKSAHDLLNSQSLISQQNQKTTDSKLNQSASLVKLITKIKTLKPNIRKKHLFD